MVLKRIDRFLDILEQYKNILDVAAGAYIKKVNSTQPRPRKEKEKEDTKNGRYQQATGKSLGLINRKNS